MLGVSPSARCSCRPPPPITPTTTGPVWMPSRTASWTPYWAARRVFRVVMAWTMPRPGVHRAPGIVFMGRGVAKIDQQPIAEVLGNMALVALDDLGRGLLVGAHHGAQVFRVELARELRGAHQVAEQHRELPPFGVRSAAGHHRGDDGHVV